MAELVTKADLLAPKQELQSEFRSSCAELRSSIETLNLRLTVRFGAMLAVAIGALATIMKLTQ